MNIETATSDQASPPAFAGRIAIAHWLDTLPLTGLHLVILALCTLGLAADIGEVALSNTFSALLLAPPYHASRAAVSLLLAAVFAGGAVGAPLFGWWGDRRGRRATLQIALALLTLGSLAVALSPNIGAMTAFRFVSGLALGGYPPLTAAYLSDVLPPLRRGPLMMLCAALAFLGAPLMILLIRWLTPLAPLSIEGWRWALFLGAGISGITAVLFFLVPESPRWLAAAGRLAEAAKSCRRFAAPGRKAPPLIDETKFAPMHAQKDGNKTFAVEPRQRRRLLLLGLLYALGPWATIGFPLLSAAVMVQKGFHVGDSLLFAGVSMFGPTLGIAAAAAFVDRIERRLALALCAIVMAALGIAFALGTGLTPLILLGTGFNLASAVYSAVLALYGAELFPTRLRATATAGAWGIGRVVSMLVPILLLPLLGSQGPLAMFGVIATALLLSAALVLAGPPGLARQPVE